MFPFPKSPKECVLDIEMVAQPIDIIKGESSMGTEAI